MPMRATHRLLLASLLLGALLAAPVASAVYITTPLKIQVSDDAPEAGDTVTLTLLRDPEYKENVSLAGKTIVVKYNFDPQEGQENSTPPEEGTARTQSGEIGTVTLDDKEGATLTWTIPQELDDHNAFLTALDENGEDVGIGYGPIAVGDAPPMMMIMRNPASGGAEPVAPDETPPPTGAPGEEPPGDLDDGAPPASAPTTDDTVGESAGDENATPGIGLAASVAVAALAALVLRRR